MSSSDCTSSASSPMSSSPLNKSGIPPTPPPPPILGPLLSDDDNDAMSDDYPDRDTSDEPTAVMGRRSMTPCETMQSQEQNLGADDPAANNLLPDSSDASTSESASLANKEDESPIAGPSSARGGPVAAKRGLRRIDPKSKKILKSRLVPVRKSQLTPRMALYIPPHLQKQTQHVTPAPKTVSSPTVALTPQQKHREKEIYEKMKLVARTYQLKQYNGFSGTLTRRADRILLSESKKTKHARKPLPAKLWTTEMENFLLNRNTHHEKFVEMGEEDQLKESKLAKRKLRKLLRKARSKPAAMKNPYKILERTHEEYEKTEAFKKFKGSKTYEERKSRPSNDPGGSTSFEMSHDVGDHLEEEYDSSFFLSLSQRHEARMEWSEAILEFNSSPASRLRSAPEIVKVEIIDSDEDSVQNESPTIVKSSSAPDKNSKRYGKFDSIGRSQNPPTPRSSKQSSNSSTTQGSMDVSNNEYLNQQFLRRQHDYEREQKYHQIELASESNEFLRGSSENLFRGRDAMDDPLRLHPPVGPFPPMFGAPVNANSLRFPPVLPIRNIYSAVGPLPEREPEEPFVGERRRRPPHPALVAPMLLESGQSPSLKEHLVDLHGRSHAKVRRVRSSSPGSCYPINEVNGSHPLEVGRNLTLFRSSLENSPIVRNYSKERITSREYPLPRPLSPFSERIMRAAEKDSRRTRQLSPFSERMQNRESSARRLSPFSERMRSRDNIDRHSSPPGRESNVKSEIVQYPLRKSTLHHGGRELYSDRPGDDRAKLSSRHVRSTDRHRSPSNGAFGSRGEINQRGSGGDRFEAQRSRYRRGRELADHVPQCPGLAMQTNQDDANKKSSTRRRESGADSRMMSGNLSKRNHEAGNKFNSRKQSEIRKRTRDESSSRAPPSLGKRQRR